MLAPTVFSPTQSAVSRCGDTCRPPSLLPLLIVGAILTGYEHFFRFSAAQLLHARRLRARCGSFAAYLCATLIAGKHGGLKA